MEEEGHARLKGRGEGRRVPDWVWGWGVLDWSARGDSVGSHLPGVGSGVWGGFRVRSRLPRSLGVGALRVLTNRRYFCVGRYLTLV